MVRQFMLTVIFGIAFTLSYAIKKKEIMKTANYNIWLDPIIWAKAEDIHSMFGLNLSEAIADGVDV